MSGEVHILKGFDAIVNQDNVRPGVDLKALERQMISGGIVKQSVKERDPSDKLNDALSRAAKKLGINFDDVAGKSVGTQSFSEKVANTPKISSPFARAPNSPYRGSTKVSSPYHGNTGGGGGMGSTGGGGMGSNGGGNTGGIGGGSNYENDEGTGGGGNYENDEGAGDNEDDNSDHGDYRPEETPPDVFARNTGGGGYSGNSGGGSLLSRTLEQERRSHIDTVVGHAGNIDFSLEKEKREDLKCSMLAEIDSLLTSLSMEEINLERIPTVTMKSTYEEVETTLKILRHKNDQTRCCTFAEEGLMFAAYALEDLFDGKNVWFGRWSPDLTGYHNQMNVKLRRVRYDTGQIVGAIMEDYNIGPGLRIGLEIVPNMFLYSKMRKQQHSQPSLGTEDADVERAQTNLRNL
jgi:hypothetical protein